MEIKEEIKSYLFCFIVESAVVRNGSFYDAKTMFKSLRLNRSHFTVGVTRRLLLSSRVSSLVINLITIRERV